ncbi:type II CAAX prenyl endopeptidase Rce1 family protein [Planctomycetota bacterium]
MICDPYALVIAAAIAWASLAALRARRGDPPGATDAVVFLLLWIPFDLRWFCELYCGPHGDHGYELWALYVTTLGIVGWGVLRAYPALGLKLPGARDLCWGMAALVAFGAIAIPVGAWTGFLRWNPRLPDVAQAVLQLVGIALFVALPEELYFRGIMQSGLAQRLKRPVLALLLTSLAFGLMHWNNAGELREQLIYCGLAAVAGVFYGIAFRYGRGLGPAILCHTAVDWVWISFLR